MDIHDSRPVDYRYNIIILYYNIIIIIILSIIMHMLTKIIHQHNDTCCDTCGTVSYLRCITSRAFLCDTADVT